MVFFEIQRLEPPKIAASDVGAAIMFMGSMHHPHKANSGNAGSLLHPRGAGETEANAPVRLVGRETTAI